MESVISEPNILNKVTITWYSQTQVESINNSSDNAKTGGTKHIRAKNKKEYSYKHLIQITSHNNVFINNTSDQPTTGGIDQIRAKKMEYSYNHLMQITSHSSRSNAWYTGQIDDGQVESTMKSWIQSNASRIDKIEVGPHHNWWNRSYQGLKDGMQLQSLNTDHIIQHQVDSDCMKCWMLKQCKR